MASPTERPEAELWEADNGPASGVLAGLGFSNAVHLTLASYIVLELRYKSDDPHDELGATSFAERATT